MYIHIYIHICLIILLGRARCPNGDTHELGNEWLMVTYTWHCGHIPPHELSAWPRKAPIRILKEIALGLDFN